MRRGIVSQLRGAFALHQRAPSRSCASAQTNNSVWSSTRGGDIYGKAQEPYSDEPETFFASVALVGAPNAGKSTLMNRMVGTRLAAVNRKVNTTRRRIIGLSNDGPRQLAFYDTPGVVERQFVNDLGEQRRQLARAAWGAAAESNLAILLMDASRPRPHWERVANLSKQLLEVRRETTTEYGPNVVFALNKIDAIKPRARVLDVIEFMCERIPEFETTFLGGRPFIISAARGDGVDDVKAMLFANAQRGELEGPTDDPAAFEETRDVCLEHLWEKLLHSVHQELPYACEFENEKWIEHPSGDITMNETIRVPRRSCVPILLGQGGANIRWIAEEAAKSASETLGRRVFIRLRVAVSKR